MSHGGSGRVRRVFGTRGRVLTFQLHICQLVGRAETMSVQTDRTVFQGSCIRDQLSQPSFTSAPSVVLTNMQETPVWGTLPFWGTQATEISITLRVFSTSFNTFFLELGFKEDQLSSVF